MTFRNPGTCEGENFELSELYFLGCQPAQHIYAQAEFLRHRLDEQLSIFPGGGFPIPTAVFGARSLRTAPILHIEFELASAIWN